MKNYVVLVSPFSNKLGGDYEEIQGETAIAAAREFVKGRFNTVKRSADRYVNLALVEGRYDKAANMIYTRGPRQWYLCE